MLFLLVRNEDNRRQVIFFALFSSLFKLLKLPFLLKNARILALPHFKNLGTIEHCGH